MEVALKRTKPPPMVTGRKRRIKLLFFGLRGMSLEREAGGIALGSMEGIFGIGGKVGIWLILVTEPSGFGMRLRNLFASSLESSGVVVCCLDMFSGGGGEWGDEGAQVLWEVEFKGINS